MNTNIDAGASRPGVIGAKDSRNFGLSESGAKRISRVTNREEYFNVLGGRLIDTEVLELSPIAGAAVRARSRVGSSCRGSGGGIWTAATR